MIPLLGLVESISFWKLFAKSVTIHEQLNGISMLLREKESRVHYKSVKIQSVEGEHVVAAPHLGRLCPKIVPVENTTTKDA